MEFGLREYLLILGSILIVGLLVDGVRRTIKHRRQGLKLDLIASPPESPARTDVSPPRPVKRATPEDLEPKLDRDPLFDSGDASQLNLWASEIKPETMKPADQNTLQEPLVDLTSDPLFAVNSEPRPEASATPEAQEQKQVKKSGERKEPVFDVEPPIEMSKPQAEHAESDASTPTQHEQESEPQPEVHGAQVAHEADMAILTEGPMSAPIEAASESKGVFSGAVSRLFGFAKSADASLTAVPEQSATGAEAEAFPVQDQVEHSAVAPEPSQPDLSDMVVIQVKPARAERFVGVNLHTACLRAGLRRTDQDVYQRIPMNQSNQALFSLVNAIEPGTFDEDAKSIDAPGFFLFTQLSKQTDPVFAVNELISGARSIAREIGGDIYDDSGVAISKDWIDLARAKAGHQHLMRP
jgi:cell division protein ZipA